MAAPARPEDTPQDTPAANRVVVGMDDLGDLLAGDPSDTPTRTPNAQDLFNQRLEGDTIPEHLRGKTVADVLSHAASLGEALKISERARTDMAKFADRPVNVHATPVAPADPGPKTYTEDEINEMFRDNPAKAIQTIWNAADALVERRVEQRIAPIRNSAVSAAEATARREYALEFELFGDQIKEMYNNTPDKMIFSNPQAWTDMVRFIRGDSANIDKLVEARQAKAAGGARTAQAASAGFHAPPVQHTSRSAASPTLDDPLKREIADKLGMDYNEYLKWEAAGR